MANARPRKMTSKLEMAAYDEAMTSQKTMRASHRAIVREQSSIAARKMQSVRSLRVRRRRLARASRAPRSVTATPRNHDSRAREFRPARAEWLTFSLRFAPLLPSPAAAD
jgi:hypothetical protein